MEPAIRVGDAERDAVALRLRDALTEGRITVEEFSERLDRAFAARTKGDLDGLTDDLPKLRTPRRKRTPWQRFRHRTEGYLGVNVMVWGIWGVQVANGGSLHDLWPLWVSVPMAIAIFL